MRAALACASRLLLIRLKRMAKAPEKLTYPEALALMFPEQKDRLLQGKLPQCTWTPYAKPPSSSDALRELDKKLTYMITGKDGLDKSYPKLRDKGDLKSFWQEREDYWAYRSLEFCPYFFARISIASAARRATAIVEKHKALDTIQAGRKKAKRHAKDYAEKARFLAKEISLFIDGPADKRDKYDALYKQIAAAKGLDLNALSVSDHRLLLSEINAHGGLDKGLSFLDAVPYQQFAGIRANIEAISDLQEQFDKHIATLRSALSALTGLYEMIETESERLPKKWVYPNLWRELFFLELNFIWYVLTGEQSAQNSGRMADFTDIAYQCLGGDQEEWGAIARKVVSWQSGTHKVEWWPYWENPESRFSGKEPDGQHILKEIRQTAANRRADLIQRQIEQDRLLCEAYQYLGYTARVEICGDEIFIGHIAGINHVVGFHADSVAALKAAFEKAVDDYFEACEKAGKAPETPAQRLD